MKKKFKTVIYHLGSSKIKGDDLKFAVLADLHGLVYGKHNSDLEKAIVDARPDAVLVAGDMIVRSDLTSFDRVGRFLERLAEKLPVYYALGNHEYQIYLNEERRAVYEEYETKLKKTGVVFLRNEKTSLRIKGTDVMLHGLELPDVYFGKPRAPRLSREKIESLVGKPSGDMYHILLAHSPRFGDAYLDWGADLILSGHYHGGMLRFTRQCGLISPQFQIFPRYCCGKFSREDHTMIVSAGLGEHTIPLRIHNPRELLMINITKK